MKVGAEGEVAVEVGAVRGSDVWLNLVTTITRTIAFICRGWQHLAT